MSKLNNRNFVIRAKRGLAADLAGLSGNLYEGEFAYTTDDNKLYVGDGSGDPVEVGGGGSGSPGGSDTQVQYNNAGTFGGAANWTHSGGNLNIVSGGQLLYNNSQIIQAQTALGNFYEGGSGNLTGTGTFNLGTGSGALVSITSGDNNTAVGAGAAANILTGTANFALGGNSLSGNTGGSNNIAIGKSALQNGTNPADCIGIGGNSLFVATGALNAVAIGNSSQGSVTSGPYNTSIGYQALRDLVSGGYNVAIGMQAMYGCTGDQNIAIGTLALGPMTSGTRNIGIGTSTGGGITTGGGNTIIGHGIAGLSSSLTDCVIIGVGNNTIVVDYNKSTASAWTFKDAGATWNFRLPTTNGTSGHFLQTDGSGNTSWAAGGGGGTPGGSSGEIQYNNAGIFGGLTDAQVATRVETLIATATALTSIQGRTVTLADAGADALLGWDDSASAYQNLSAADAKTALGLGTTDTPQFAGINHGNASDTTVARQGAGVLAVEGKMIYATGTVTLTDGATPALDAALGSTFTLSAAGDRTIAVPSNPQAGQKIVIAHTASGANRTLALNTGAGGFRFGTDVTGLTLTTSGLTDYIGAIYNATASRWDVVAYTKGY